MHGTEAMHDGRRVPLQHPLQRGYLERDDDDGGAGIGSRDKPAMTMGVRLG